LEASQYLRILRRWWWLFVASTLVGAIVAYVASSQITPTYEATTKMLVVTQQTQGIIQRNDLETSQLLANTFSGMITVRPILERAIAQGGFDMSVGELRQSISISTPPSTQLLQVTAHASDPVLARDIANVVSTVFIDSDELALTSSTGRVSIIEPATSPSAPIAPRKSVNAALGGALAVFACALLVLLFEYIDDTVKSAQDVTDLVGLATLGQVEAFGRTASPSDQLQVALRPRSPLAESYRALRTNLTNVLARYNGDGGLRSLLFTGGSRHDGKSTTVANLAVVFGLAGYRVAVVDGDLRAPTLHRVFSLDNSDGLTNVLLSDQVPAGRAMQRTVHTNVSVLTSGPIPSNPSELLGSPRMRDVMAELQSQYDLVLVDSPPVIGVTDASVIAGIVDAIVVIVRPGRTRTGELRTMVEQTAASGKPIIGVVLNRARGNTRAMRYGDAPVEVTSAAPTRSETRPNLRTIPDDDLAIRR